MAKDDRSPINPFTGKEHYDVVNDDDLLEMCFKAYADDINNSELLDDTDRGQLVFSVASNLVNTVETFLRKINRYDYVDGYYEWEFHLSNNKEVNAYCAAGGKILVYSGLFQIVNTEEELAFVLAHEMSHALLDHIRTKFSVQETKNSLTAVSLLGSFALDLMGHQNAAAITRSAINIADIGSHFFLTQPWGRDHEFEADKLGMIITHLAGYDISVVPDFWERFSGDNGNSFDFFSTHPSDAKRIAVMKESLDDILNETDFYSKPVLPETPVPKIETNGDNLNSQIPTISSNQPAIASTLTNSKIQSNESCSNCGSVIAPNTKFCTVCGNKIEKENPLACPECGFITSKGDNFCKSCGYKMIQDITCSKCGEQVFENQSFCTHCGNKL